MSGKVVPKRESVQHLSPTVVCFMQSAGPRGSGPNFGQPIIDAYATKSAQHIRESAYLTYLYVIVPAAAP
jgi:hypothetical protein